MFGGVYLWGALILAAALSIFLIALRPQPAPPGPLRIADLAVAAVLLAALFQAVPLPVSVVRVLSPARESFVNATSLQTSGNPAWVPLTLDPAATLHAWLSLSCIAAAYWTARGIFSRGGIRTFSTVIAWGAIAIVLAAFAQHASGTTLVYGVWHPGDGGARPLGPFINRNHLGTWSILALWLCAGYLQWRGQGTSRPASWRATVSRWLDARRIVLQLAVVLLASALALGASRSALVALACAAGYVAWAAPRDGRRLSLALLAGCAIVAMLGYGDGQRLLMRMDETRTVGMANRVAIWKDTVQVIHDFPVAGVGAGAFAPAMRVYQTSPRTYYHNDAHNQYLQLAAEGGLLLGIPAIIAIGALCAAAWRQLRRRDDPVRWIRIAACAGLVGVAVQSIWETGLTLPANGMFAAALAALVVHTSARGELQ